MKTITLNAEVTGEGKLKLDVPCDLPPGPVEVVMVIQPRPQDPAGAVGGWDHLHGLGREVWQGVEAGDYVRRLREDREPGR